MLGQAFKSISYLDFPFKHFDNWLNLFMVSVDCILKKDLKTKLDN